MGIYPHKLNINYFFAIRAFRTKANNPAGISPVVKSSFKLIPKSGIFLTKSSIMTLDSKKPTMSRFILINKF